METANLKKLFLEKFGGNPENIRVFSSSGRVNLIGEHTDYSGGYVFPAALSMGTVIVARARNDGIIRMMSTDLDVLAEGSVKDLQSYKNLEWGNYQFGVADELIKAGYPVSGADMLYHDTLPHGAGLSASAAIEVATALALLSLSGVKDIDKIELAKISQLAENRYIGVNCGIMDQFASAMGKKNHAIFLRCKNLSYKLVPLELGDYKIVISNTNKKHSLASSKYNERRSECEQGFDILKQAFPDAECLGDISYSDYKNHESLISNPIIKKRIEHVISENDRVLKSIDALNSGNLDLFGKFMNASHVSLRDLYEVSCHELDVLVDEALKIDGVISSRMTGAGFGGCTVSLVHKDATDLFVKNVGKAYKEKIGYDATFYISETGDGAKEII